MLASLTRAIERFEGAPERTLRSLTGALCGPVVTGEAEILVERLRAGSGVSTVAARVVQQGEVQAHAVAILGKTRPVDLRWNELSAPQIPSWRGMEAAPMGPPMTPVFFQNFEVRSTGPLPWTQGPEAVAEGWVRPRSPGPARDAAYLVGMADVWWPALFARIDAPRPIATIAYTLQRIGDLEGLDPDAPLKYRARVVSVGDGYATEMRELWGEDDRLLALNQQTIAVIR